MGLVIFTLLLASCAPLAEAPTSAPEGQSVIETGMVEKEEEVGDITDEFPAVEEPVEEPPAESVVSTTTPAAQPTVVAPTATQARTSPPDSPTPVPTLMAPTPTPVVEQRVVELEWPGSLHLGDSDIIRLALVPSVEGYTVTTEFPDHQTVTQDVPVVRPSGYDLSAVARLDGVGFSLDPQGDQVLSLPVGETVVWRWSISPLAPGKQRLTVTLLLRWVPLPGTAGTIREAVAYSKGLDVRVNSFFGLTRGQAMTTGLFGLIFGGGLAIVALVYRPRKPRSSMQVRRANPQTVIEKPAGLLVSSLDETLLRTLFDRYARLVIQSEFMSGYSGARTFLLLPLRLDGRADAYTIAKLGELKAIQNEYQNYETFVKHTLPPITARIQNPPVTVRGGKKAVLQYTFIGEPGSTPTSLRDALLADPDPSLLIKLFETFGPNWWMQRNPFIFRLAQEYDRMMPPHYVLEPDIGSGVVLDGNEAPASQVGLSVGERVTLRNFPQQEQRPDGRSFSLKGEVIPGQPLLRVHWMGRELPKRPTGRVIATREITLRSYVSDFDRFGLPDPLEILPRILNENVIASKSTIHGDLNLENILVGPGGFVWLIDFATTREGHPQADFAHLEAEIIAHVIAPQLPSPDSYLAILEGDQRSPFAHLLPLVDALREIAARCLFDSSQQREYHLALYMSCLGALKYRNLEGDQKHLLYLTAAKLAQEL
jgi:hypothetical protein